MVDVLTKKQRSFNMSMIRAKNTKPELRLFEELTNLGLVFEKHYNVIGKPDIVFVKEKLAIFLDGVFWHGRYYKVLKDKLPPYWQKKIENNMKRDRKNRRLLKKDGWSVIRIWDDEFKKFPEKQINKIKSQLNQVKNGK